PDSARATEPRHRRDRVIAAAMSADKRGSDTAPMSPATAEGAQSARHPVSLLLYHRDGGELVPLRPWSAVVVVREPPSDVVISDARLSRQHARFTLLGDEVVVQDLGSTNGTRVAGAAVEHAVVQPGDELRLGAIIGSLHVSTSDPKRADRPAR